MKKEYKWDVELDGVPHTILCVANDNGYDLYDGDDYITRVYKKSAFHNLRGGIETDVEIAGRVFRFIAWRWEYPDLAYNGQMLGSGTSYDEARKLYCKSVRISNWITVAASFAFLVYEVVWLCLRGESSRMIWIALWLLFGGVSAYRILNHRK